MTQPLWFLGARFNIIADATTTGGKYDWLDETAPPDMDLFRRICAEIGDEVLGAPGDLPRQAAISIQR